MALSSREQFTIYWRVRRSNPTTPSLSVLHVLQPAHLYLWAQVAELAVPELCQIPPETPVKYRNLGGYADAHRCCGKLLMESALVRVDARY